MKSNIIFLLLTALFLIHGSLFAAITLPLENNSNSLANELSSEIIRKPSGSNVPFYAGKLMELAPAAGNKKIQAVFKEGIKKLENNSERGNPVAQFLGILIDELEGNSNESINHFSIIRKWNISGPWKRYGKPDIDFQFNPERVFKLDDIEKGRNILTEENGVLYPYKYNHAEDETLYATSSFAAAEAIILWIISDAQYRLFINGKEIAENKTPGKKIVKAFSLSGGKGYTLQIKMQSGRPDYHPYLVGMITDLHHKPVKLTGSSTIFNYRFTSEKIFSSNDDGESVPQEAAVLTSGMRELLQSGNLSEGYKLGVSITKKFPSYYPAYSEFIPLLDVMDRDEEFYQYIEKFKKIFPDAYIHQNWLTDFYMTRDREKFQGNMKTVPLRYLSEKSVETYLYQLCGEKKYAAAITLCTSLKGNPRFRHIIPEVIRASGSSELWKKMLIEGAAVRDESDFYYSLGLSEMQAGLDPVMYWNKAYQLDDNPGLMRDLSDLYENSILNANDFYSGQYTDLHHDFRWNAKKRKVSVHLFESGRVLIEGVDIIPPGKKIHGEKYSDGWSGYSDGEITTGIPFVKGLKILYVLTAKDGLSSPADFNSFMNDKNQITVKYKCSGEEEFSVIKYSGEYFNPAGGQLTFVKELIIKSENEKISDLEYEVICHGDFKPEVYYNDETLSSGRYSDGIVKYFNNDKLSEGDTEAIKSKISRFSSEKEFAGWYSKIVAYACRSNSAKSKSLSNGENISGISRRIHFFVMSAVSGRDGINFNPSGFEEVLKSGEGTVEEKTLLAKAILEKEGIKSFIAFKKAGRGLIGKILLYVPENRDRGYWLEFYGDGILDKTEPGHDALVITEDGYETLPVNPETYIR